MSGQFPTGSRQAGAFALLCPHVCRSGADLGMFAERLVLLNPFALGLVVNGSLVGEDVGVRPYKYHPVGADALVGLHQPPGQRQRKENARVSGPSPD